MNWLRLHVSNVCNFKCPNCHVFELGENVLPSQLMTLETFNESIGQIVKVLEKKKDTSVRVSIYGGEALANKKVIKQGIQNASTKFPQINFKWIVNTNGSLINDEDAMFFKENKVELHVSVDGVKAIHNLSRPLRSGKGTFEKVVHGIELLFKYEVEIQINSYMMPTNFKELSGIVDLAKKYKVKKIYLDQFYNEEMGKYSEWFEEYRKVFHYAQLCGIEIFGPWKRVLERKLYNRQRVDDLNNFFQFDVNVDGTFYLSNFVESKKYNWKIYELYNLFDGNYQNQVKKIKEKREISCEGCELSRYCLGEAKEQVYYHINLNAETESSCLFYKNITSYLLRPIYYYSIEKIRVISFYERNKIDSLVSSIQSAVIYCGNFFNITPFSFLCRILETKEELWVASGVKYPEWVKASTKGNQLNHVGIVPTIAMRHEIAHLFLKNLNLRLPNWFEEGVCEWVDLGENKHPELSRIKEGENFLKDNLFAGNLVRDVDLSYSSNGKPRENEKIILSHGCVLYLVKKFGQERVLDFLKTEGEFESSFHSFFDININDFVSTYLGEANV